MNADPNTPMIPVVVVEKNAGVCLGAGLVAMVVGSAVYLSSAGSFNPSDGAMLIASLLVLVGFGLLVTGITKAVKNIEVTATATVTAENLLRDIRNVTVAQYHENRNARES